jgi:hypothetical protein
MDYQKKNTFKENRNLTMAARPTANRWISFSPQGYAAARLMSTLCPKNKGGSLMRFQIIINGKKICTAGVKDYGVLSAIVSWLLRDPAKYDSKKHPSLEEFSAEETCFQIGAMLNDGSHVEWDRRKIKAGDEITIKILEPGKYDDPRKKG